MPPKTKLTLAEVTKHVKKLMEAEKKREREQEDAEVNDHKKTKGRRTESKRIDRKKKRKSKSKANAKGKARAEESSSASESSSSSSSSEEEDQEESNADDASSKSKRKQLKKKAKKSTSTSKKSKKSSKAFESASETSSDSSNVSSTTSESSDSDDEFLKKMNKGTKPKKDHPSATKWTKVALNLYRRPNDDSSLAWLHPQDYISKHEEDYKKDVLAYMTIVRPRYAEKVVELAAAVESWLTLARRNKEGSKKWTKRILLSAHTLVWYMVGEFAQTTNGAPPHKTIDACKLQWTSGQLEYAKQLTKKSAPKNESGEPRFRRQRFQRGGIKEKEKK